MPAPPAVPRESIGRALAPAAPGWPRPCGQAPPHGCRARPRRGRLSRWKRTPRTRGSAAYLVATPRPLPGWRHAVETVTAGMFLAAGIGAWGLVLALLGS
jgi:hypothetical protein